MKKFCALGVAILLWKPDRAVPLANLANSIDLISAVPTVSSENALLRFTTALHALFAMGGLWTMQDERITKTFEYYF
jgi:hypothetical protein